MARSKARGCFGVLFIMVGTLAVASGLMLGCVATEDDHEKAAAHQQAWDEYTEWVESEDGIRYDSLSQALFDVTGEDSLAIENQLKEMTPVEYPGYRADGLGTFLGWLFGGAIIFFGLLCFLFAWLLMRKKKEKDPYTESIKL